LKRKVKGGGEIWDDCHQSPMDCESPLDLKKTLQILQMLFSLGCGSKLSSSSAQQRRDFPRLRTISQHRFTKVHRVSFIVLRAQSSPFVAKRALALFFFFEKNEKKFKIVR